MTTGAHQNSPQHTSTGWPHWSHQPRICSRTTTAQCTSTPRRGDQGHTVLQLWTPCRLRSWWMRSEPFAMWCVTRAKRPPKQQPSQQLQVNRPPAYFANDTSWGHFGRLSIHQSSPRASCIWEPISPALSSGRDIRTFQRRSCNTTPPSMPFTSPITLAPVGGRRRASALLHQSSSRSRCTWEMRLDCWAKDFSQRNKTGT